MTRFQADAAKFYLPDTSFFMKLKQNLFSICSHRDMTGGKKTKQINWLSKNENSMDFTLKQAKTMIERDWWAFSSMLLSLHSHHGKFPGLFGYSLPEQAMVLILRMTAEE